MGTRSPRERLQEALYEASLKRLKRRGLDDDRAGRVAGEVARQVAGRVKTPDFASPQELAGASQWVCQGLSDGRSYYDLIAERPYLAMGRIDRLVAAAGHVRPPVPAETASAARKAMMLERLAGGLAVLFTAATLATLGIWYALLVGALVSAGSELYVQTGMPRRARLLAARYRAPRWVGLLALLAILWASYAWLAESRYAFAASAGLTLFVVGVVAVVPGFVLATLVASKERKWRGALEKELADKEAGGSGS